MTCNPGYDRWRTSGPPEPTDEQEERAELVGGLNERANEAASITLNADDACDDLTISSTIDDIWDDKPRCKWKLTFEMDCYIDNKDDMIVLAQEYAHSAQVFADAIHDY